MMVDHEAIMRAAIRLAEQGIGTVSPNPPVGAVAVRDGRVIAEGYHRKFGGPHAEADLIGNATVDFRGADLYVTLEPCAFHGKTPPCSDAVIAAGFSRVFCGCDDPNPLTSGKSYEQFAAAGIGVHRDVLSSEARSLIAPYLCRTRYGRPLVTAKWAMSLDGKIASRSGDAAWISAEETRNTTRAERATFDAILIGSGTAQADDPKLTTSTDLLPNPRRVILDSTLQLDRKSQLVRTVGEAPVWVYASANHSKEPEFVERKRVLQECGVVVEVIDPDHSRGVCLDRLLACLSDRGFTSLLVEGGGQVLGSFCDQGKVDRVCVVISPKVIGGTSAPGPVAGLGLERMSEVHEIAGFWRNSAPDQIFTGFCTPEGRGEINPLATAESEPDSAI